MKNDPTNMGINGSLFVLEPSMDEFASIKEDVYQPDILCFVGDLFDWPDMQYLTMRWSGKWINVDLRFSGFNGYPDLTVLYGIHYAGFKPWYIRKPEAMARYARHDDFQLWFREYIRMMKTYPELNKVKKLSILQQNIKKLSYSFAKEPDLSESLC